MPSLPGTPRWSTDIVCDGNKIYLLGGVSGQTTIASTKEGTNDKLYKTVIDNWIYDIRFDKWKRLPDTPFVLGNWMFQRIYKNYILLIGGAGYFEVDTDFVNVSVPNNLNHQHSELNYNYLNDYLYTNAVYIFDMNTNKFHQSTPLPFDWNGATVWLVNNTIYLNAGEAGSACWNDRLISRHPSIMLKGKILL